MHPISPSRAITKFQGESFTHRILWTCALHQLRAGEKTDIDGAQWFLLSALLTAYLAYEAYLNFLGDRLAPDVWRREKEFFRKPPYQGINGKLEFILETLVSPKVNKGARPYQTIAWLENFRDLVVHGKPEKYEGEIEHPIDIEPQVLQSKIWALIERSAVKRAFEDVEKFACALHDSAKPKLSKDVWFGDKPFNGSTGYAHRKKSLRR